MKHQICHFSLYLIAIGAAMLATGCTKSNWTPRSVFEAQPRPLLESVGLSASWDPRLAVDTTGALYLFLVYEHDSKSRLGLAMSENGADTLNPRILPISEDDVSIGSHGEQSPSIAMTRAEIYALWQESLEDGSGTIMSARSLSWGESFDKPVQVSDKEAHSYKGFSSIGVAPNGDVYAVWLDERDNPKPGEETAAVYIAKSTDRGATFGRNVRVAEGACPCCRPSLAFGPHNEIFVGWRRVFPEEIRDVVVSTSYDSGRTFAAPVRVNEDGWKLNGCPDSGPALSESNGVLYIAWMTEGKEERPRVQFARSDDAARSFSKPTDISGGILDPNHPAMRTGDDGTIWVAFQGRPPSPNGGWSKTQAYLVQINPGRNPSLPMPIPGSDDSISYPTFALASGGRIFLAWTQPQGDHQTIMLSRGRAKS